MSVRGATRAVVVAGATHLGVSAFRLTVVRGPDVGLSLRSTSDSVIVGSDDHAGLVLRDPTVSRFHCEIAVVDGRVRLRDLGSRNGTVVGGVAVVSGHLLDGAVLQIGNSDVRFDLDDAEVRLPLHDAEGFGPLVGRAASMRRAFSLIATAARSDVPVLLLGETGTGKDAAASAIHEASTRADKPFVVVDCSAIPAELIESELFGHEKGAFTGATTAREGLFEAADGGTVLLDEIGELPLLMQPKLLRVLESRSVKRVGGTRSIPIDVRVIAATNRDLRVEVNEKRFRPDLFYRLAVLEIALPPLRERSEDLPLLVERLLAHYDVATRAPLLTPAFIEGLAGHAWPGNVRELRNHLERCLAMREALPASSLSLSSSSSSSPGAAVPSSSSLPDTALPLKDAREAWTRQLERRYVEVVLAQHHGNVAAAARAAGVDRMYFYRLLWRYGLREHKDR
jgi:two-component system, NtrC family, response regulator GlrR